MRLIDRTNPVSRVATAIIMTVPLLMVLEPVSPLVVTGLSCLAFRWCGMSFVAQIRRFLVLLTLAPVAGISMLLYGKPAGHRYLDWGVVVISQASIWSAMSVVCRVFGLGVPVILLLAHIDPTDLADGLIQIVKVPQRFVMGSVAGFRTVSLFVQDWRQLSLARRARGLADVWVVRRWVSAGFAMLVIALRRADKIATAMEARSFGNNERSQARRSQLSWADVHLVCGGIGIVATGFIVAAICATLVNPWG